MRRVEAKRISACGGKRERGASGWKNADAARLDDGKGSGQRVAAGSYKGCKLFGNVMTQTKRVAKKDDTAMTIARGKDKLAEVLVFGEQKARVFPGSSLYCHTLSRSDFGVRRLDAALVRPGLTGRHAVRQAAPKKSGVKPPHSIIQHGEWVLRTSGRGKNEFLMSKGVGRIGDGRMNRIRGKLRVRIDQGFDGRAFSQFSKHEFDRDSRAVNGWLAEHHHRVDADVVLNIHTLNLGS
jgi:hypothetical protein